VVTLHTLPHYKNPHNVRQRWDKTITLSFPAGGPFPFGSPAKRDHTPGKSVWRTRQTLLSFLEGPRPAGDWKEDAAGRHKFPTRYNFLFFSLTFGCRVEGRW
jgi:hypothetical protein